jgi:flagellar hook-basal body complex protein FliE
LDIGGFESPDLDHAAKECRLACANYMKMLWACMKKEADDDFWSDGRKKELKRLRTNWLERLREMLAMEANDDLARIVLSKSINKETPFFDQFDFPPVQVPGPLRFGKADDPVYRQDEEEDNADEDNADNDDQLTKAEKKKESESAKLIKKATSTEGKRQKKKFKAKEKQDSNRDELDPLLEKLQVKILKGQAATKRKKAELQEKEEGAPYDAMLDQESAEALLKFRVSSIKRIVHSYVVDCCSYFQVCTLIVPF